MTNFHLYQLVVDSVKWYIHMIIGSEEGKDNTRKEVCFDLLTKEIKKYPNKNLVDWETNPLYNQSYWLGLLPDDPNLWGFLPKRIYNPLMISTVIANTNYGAWVNNCLGVIKGYYDKEFITDQVEDEFRRAFEKARMAYLCRFYY